MTQEYFQTLQDVDIRTVDRNLLVDVRDIQIDKSLSQQEYVLEYLRQIKNPYCHKYGGYVVKNSFNSKYSLEEQLEQVLLNT